MTKIFNSGKLPLLIILIVVVSGCRAASTKIERADALYNAGVIYLERGDYENAIESLKNAKNLDPNAARIYNALGLVYHNYGMFEKAIECYLKSLELKSNAPNVNNNLAATFLQIGKFDDAIQQCDITLSDKSYLSPSVPYYNKALAYYALGNTNKAKIFFLKSLEEEPNFDQAHYGLAKVYKDLNDLKNSVKHLNQAIEINPIYTEAYYELGLILFGIKEDLRSLIYFEKVLQLSPGSEYFVKAQSFINAINGRQKQ